MTLCIYRHEETLDADDEVGLVPVESRISGTGGLEWPKPPKSPTTHAPVVFGEHLGTRSEVSESPGSQLEFIRQTLGLNVSDLASALGVSRPTVYAWLEGDEPSPENYKQIARLKRVADEVDRLAIPRFEKLLKRPIFDGLSFLDKLKESEDPTSFLRPLKQLADKEHATRRSQKGSGKTLSNDGILEQSTPLYESD